MSLRAARHVKTSRQAGRQITASRVLIRAGSVAESETIFSLLRGEALARLAKGAA
jgi:hypothetical protein